MEKPSLEAPSVKLASDTGGSFERVVAPGPRSVPEVATPPFGPPLRGASSEQTDESRPAPRYAPREHGAYAILGIPLVAALVTARFDPVACWTALAAVCGFLAHEPLLLMLGQRGRRLQQFHRQAQIRLLALLATVGIAGSIAFVQGTLDVRYSLVFNLHAVGIVFLQTHQGWRRTLAAQVCAIVALTLPVATVLLAGGMPATVAWTLTAAWIVGRIATTTAIKSGLASHRAAASYRIPLKNDLVQLVASLLWLLGLAWDFTAAVTVAPLVIAGAWLRLQCLPAKYLRVAGWVLIAVNAASGVRMIVCYIQ